MKTIKTYQEAIDYLYHICPPFHQVGAAAYKPGLDTIRQLMASLGDPQDRYPTVHIAGTNGKGSTAHLIAAALQAAGLKVGLYTSPHLVDFRERIRINGQMIPEQRVTQFISDLSDQSDRSELSLPLREGRRGSFFELTTALAFTYFAEQQVDIAVIETGLGGRLDATNILTPLVSVITNIGLDHTEFLGHTLAAIAAEKAGIIKPGVPCVIGETQAETAPVFQRFFDASNSLAPSDNSPSKVEEVPEGRRSTKLYQAHSPFGKSRRGSSLFFADQCEYLRRCRLREAPESELRGAYQEKNLQTAYVALRVLRDTYPALDARAIREGFAHVCSLTGLRGRWETLSQTPLTICDTGHNSHGIRTYIDQLRELAKGDSHLRIVFGMVDDKDVDDVLALMPKEAYYYWTQADTKRAIPADELCRKGLAHGLIGLNYGPVAVAVQAAQKDAAPEDVIFIGGSNYVVGEALRVRI